MLRLSVLALVPAIALFSSACERSQRNIPVTEEPIADEHEPGHEPANPKVSAPMDARIEAQGPKPEAVGQQRSNIGEASATLAPADNQQATGSAKLVATPNGVDVLFELNGASPGEYGVQIYDKGDCRSIAPGSKGAHSSPEHQPHGAPPSPTGPAIGDRGRVEVGQDGSGRLRMSIDAANLRPAHKASLLGRALVVQRSQQKGGVDQPLSESPVPIACGVITQG